MIRLPFLVLLISIAGCSQAPGEPKLVHKATGLNEGAVPLHAVIRVANEGETGADIIAVNAEISHKSLICRPQDTGAAPAEFNHRVVIVDRQGVELRPGGMYQCQPGQTGNLHCQLQWVLPEEAPPMLAVVRTSFVVWPILGEPIKTKPLIIVLQSKPGILDSIAAANRSSPQADNRLYETLAAIEGARSDAFSSLLSKLK